jgi:hypothetical protein
MPDTRAQLAHRRDGSALKIKTKTRLGRHKVMDSRTTGPAAKLPLRQPGRRNQQRRHSDPVRRQSSSLKVAKELRSRRGDRLGRDLRAVGVEGAVLARDAVVTDRLGK